MLLVYFSSVLGFCRLLEVPVYLAPNVDLSKVKDNIASLISGYNFLKYPENEVNLAYLELLFRAYTTGKDIRELLSLECENGLNTSCGIYIYVGGGGGVYMVYVIRHHKAKRLTNHEFYVVRFLLVILGHVLYKYLIYIRKGRKVNICIYRQLVIAVTEKHIREVYTPFNRYDNCSNNADLNVVFAWQSEHRPLQRGITYRLDGAYPFKLQPSLLRAYEWASIRWHEFIRQPSKKLLLLSEVAPITPASLSTCSKRSITEVSPDCVSLTNRAFLSKRRSGHEAVTTPSEQSLQLSQALGHEDRHVELSPATHRGLSPQDPRIRGEGGPTGIDEVLYVLDEYQLLICLLCKFAIRPGKSTITHFRSMH
ncbi:Uncharacterized protein HZ326_27411 [Fusarium oxysporum f. sp. albedinis]|nr:Uncharacterized protein HZ326_27411 [Fusarium oxysporum f. sp. albedinis]